MSNAEKMVMVPRDRLEDVLSVDVARTVSALDYFREILDQPAQQHQGEPVVSPCALCCQTHEQVPVGRVGGQQANGCDVDFTAWRCEGCGGSWTGDPADPAEVERLRQRMLACEEIAENNAKACAEALTKLAEAHALLRKVQPAVSTWCNGKKSQPRADIDAALSASAEPSAQAERDELMELLRDMTCAYRGAIQAGHDRITSLGGDCDSVEKMLADLPAYAKARVALERKP